jgi:hypothetical protein
MNLRLYRPEIFQGNLKKKNYSEVNLSLFNNHDNLVYYDHGKRAGLEVIDEIFNYF